MTQRDGMGRKVGGGFRMGNTCTPEADACWCMAKPIQYRKVKIIILNPKSYIVKVYRHICYHSSQLQSLWGGDIVYPNY